MLSDLIFARERKRLAIVETKIFRVRLMVGQMVLSHLIGVRISDADPNMCPLGGMVDAEDLKFSELARTGSSPVVGTNS